MKLKVGDKVTINTLDITESRFGANKEMEEALKLNETLKVTRVSLVESWVECRGSSGNDWTYDPRDLINPPVSPVVYIDNLLKTFLFKKQTIKASKIGENFEYDVEFEKGGLKVGHQFVPADKALQIAKLILEKYS